MRRKRLACVRLDVSSIGRQSELVGGEQFFILHIVPGHAEPTAVLVFTSGHRTTSGHFNHVSAQNCT